MAAPAIDSSTARLSANYGNIRSLYGNIRSLQGDVGANYGNIRSLYGNIRSLQGDVGANYGNIRSLYGNIRSLQGDVGANYGNIRSVYGNIRSLQGDVGANYGNIRSLYGNIRSLQGDVGANYGNIRSLYGNIRSLEGGLDADYGNIRSLYGNIRSLEGALGADYGNIRSLYGNIRSLDGDVAANYGNIGSLYGNIRSLEGALAVEYGNIRSLYGNIRSLDGDITADYGNIRSLYGNIRSLEGALAAEYGNIRSLYGNIRSLEGDLGADYGNIRSLYGNIRSLGGTLGADYGNIRSLYGNIRSLEGALDPEYGNIRSLYGNIRSLDGDLAADYGNIRSLYGNIRSLEGDLSADYGNIRSLYGNIRSLYGNIRSLDSSAPDFVRADDIQVFWGDIEQLWNVVDARWGKLDTASDPTKGLIGVTAGIDELYARSASFWGDTVEAKTGKSFADGFANAVFARHGVDPNDPGSIAKLDSVDRDLFFTDWFDGLNEYSGFDHADRWMGIINWAPELSGALNAGNGATVGLLDFRVAGDADVQSKTTYTGGFTGYTNGHGAAVASLIVASHDGKGVAGLAPGASLVAYSPFDDTGTAGWEDVTKGIAALSDAGAGVINMSLGVENWALNGDWKGVFSDARIASALGKTVFVSSAGNDGVTQAADIAWDFAYDPALIVVGSIDGYGDISSFSNRPGEAKLLGADGYSEALKDRFIVAPGEMVIVSNDAGGVMRGSGTSFAAPLVTGTIALLHDRWPWLAKHPQATVDIVLGSATDLGDAGVDGVYGHGLLNVAATQQPLNPEALQWRTGGGVRPIVGLFGGGAQVPTWAANGLTATVFEKVGDTYRDFEVPASGKLVDVTYNASAPQGYFSARFNDIVSDWASRWNGADFTSDDGVGLARYGFAAGAPTGWGVSIATVRRPLAVTDRFGRSPYQSSATFVAPGGNLRFRVGEGEGARAIGGRRGFAMAADYDARGGVNPFLGLASGGAYGGVGVALAPGLEVRAGLTERRRELFDLNARRGLDRRLFAGLDPYRAQAGDIAVDYSVAPGTSFTVGYTQLTERTGLLGVQSLDPADFAGGATTDAVSLGAHVRIVDGLSLSGSATMGRTRAGSGSALSVADGGIRSTAFQVALSADRLLGRSDALRLSIAQPMHIESGGLRQSSLEVIDRATGATGLVDRNVDLQGGRRRYVAEALYGIGIADGRAQLSLFGRAKLKADGNLYGEDDTAAGARLSFNF